MSRLNDWALNIGREAAFESRAVGAKGRDALHAMQMMDGFLRANIWVGNPGPNVIHTVEVPFSVHFTAVGRLRVPSTWWDMLKESFVARCYTLATGLISWGLMRDVQYDEREVRVERTEHTKRTVDVPIRVSEVLPAAMVPPERGGPMYLREAGSIETVKVGFR